MLIEFLGGAREVGRSAILVKSDGASVILDYGVKIQPEPGEFPMLPKNVDAVIPTHGHLDHCGAIPVLAEMKPSVICTKTTAEIMELLLNDFLKVAKINGYPRKFSKDDIRKTMKNTISSEYGKEFCIKDLKFKLYDSGHIPGSSGVLVKSGKKNLYYTGDIKLIAQKLVGGCKLPKEKIDTMIIESTYGDRDHPDDRTREMMFRSEIDEALNANEHVLIPVFAVGRAQEILLHLKGYENYTVLDGMAKEATEIILRNKNSITDHTELRKIYRKVKKIENDKQRKRVMDKPSIIVSTSGMLTGGPAIQYLRKIRDRRDSRIMFVGYQVEGSPGNILLDTNIYKGEEEEFDVRCKISKFDFSSHAGRSELMKIIRKINPKRVLCVHGDSCPDFAKNIEKETGIHAEAPKNGEEINI